MNEEKLKQQFVNAVRPHLERLTERLIAELQPIVCAEYPAEIRLLDFEADSTRLTDSFPVCLYLMDEEKTQIGSLLQLLADLPLTIPREVFDSQDYEAAGMDAWYLAFQELAVWFGECWRKAGGFECLYPAYICHHDDDAAFNLKKLKWVSDREKWAAINSGGEKLLIG